MPNTPSHNHQLGGLLVSKFCESSFVLKEMSRCGLGDNPGEEDTVMGVTTSLGQVNGIIPLPCVFATKNLLPCAFLRQK